MNSIIDQQKQDAEFTHFNPKDRSIKNIGKDSCVFHKEDLGINRWVSAIRNTDPKRIFLWPETPISTQIQR